MLLKVEMGAGHGGPSGRYESWKDEAFVLAFVLDALGVEPRDPTCPTAGRQRAEAAVSPAAGA